MLVLLFVIGDWLWLQLCIGSHVHVCEFRFVCACSVFVVYHRYSRLTWI